MIEKEVRCDMNSPMKQELIEAIIGAELVNALEYGYPSENDEEAANGYLLEIVVRRKSVK